MQKVIHFLFWIVAIPANLIGLLRRFAIWVARKRWYLFGFIPCSAGLWPLGLYCWEHEFERRWVRVSLRIFSYICFFAGTFLFFAGLWRLALILLLIRVLLWIDMGCNLGAPLIQEPQEGRLPIFNHPLDRISLLFIAVVFLIMAMNKELFTKSIGDPSDNYYHMAVAQKILERGEIPLWDDWEFAPMGRPHLYPPLLHLLIAYFSKVPQNVIQGFSTIQMLLFPSALLSYWLLFRYLMGPPGAFLSLLFMSMEFIFAMGCLLGLPSSLVNVMWPMILLAVLKKRPYLGMLLLTAAFYTHTGVPMLMSLGLLIFGFWKRDYLSVVLKMISGAMLLAMPWFVRYIAFSDWMQAGGAQGYSFHSIISRLLWLQVINPVFIFLALWGLIRYKNEKLAIVRAQLVGFLPMLTQYGGRFFMHGAPFLSPFIAYPFLRFVKGNITRRRVVLFFLMAMIPLPCINFMGANDSIKPHFMMGPTTIHGCLVFMLYRENKDTSDIDNLVKAIKDQSAPSDIIHLPDSQAHFGDFLVVRTGRVTDLGGWGEVRKPAMLEAITKSRQDPNDGIFVTRSREAIPEGRRVEKVGSFYLGLGESGGRLEAGGLSGD